MARRVSLRWKLTLWVLVIFIIIQGTLSLVVLLYQQRAITNIFDEKLADRTQAMGLELASRGPPWTAEELQWMALDEARFVFFEDFHLAVFNAQGGLAVQTAEVDLDASLSPADARDNPFTQFFTPTARGENDVFFDPAQELRGAYFPFVGLDDQRYVLRVVTTWAYVDAEMQRVRDMLMLALPIGLIAALAATYLIAGIATAPFKQIEAAAGRLSPGSIRRKISLESLHPEIEHLEAELNDARRRIARGYRAQERFISNVSHELRTPIAVLLTEAQTLREDPELSDDLRSFITSVEQEMRRLARTIDGFLMLTKLEDSEQGIRRSRVPLNDVVLDSAQNCQGQAEQFGVPIEMQLYEPENGELTVTGDPDLLRTMVDNLVRNAIRFSPRGRAVELKVSTDNGAGCVSVRDHGRGIPDSLIPHIFDRFAQAPQEKRSGRGHGLGLEIAQGIAEIHGGSIRVENCVDRGCLFTVQLPSVSSPAENE